MFDLIFAAALHATIPFEFVDNRIVVNATIDGKGPFALIVDTGSQGIAVTPQAATRLGLSSTASTRIYGAGAGSESAGQIRVHSVQLGSVSLGPASALVVNLDRIRNTFHFPRLDGIVGYDALPARYVEFDMHRGEIMLSATPIRTPPAAITSHYSLEDGLFVTGAAIDGVHGPVIIDTGDRTAFTVFGPFARANGFYDLRVGERNVFTGIGVGGEIRGDVFRSTIDALGFTAFDVPTRAPLGPSGVFDSNAQIGSIGDGLLRRYDLVFDNAKRTIAAWPVATQADRPPADLPALPRHGAFGAVLGKDDGHGAPIASVVSGGPAARAGIASGDVVVAIGDTPVTTTAGLLWSLHRMRAGSETTVTVVSAGKRRTNRITLGSPIDETDPQLYTTYGQIEVDGTLRRTLVTLPKNAAKPLPAMLIIGGIGCYSVDVAAIPQDPYLNIARDVSRAGFVTMRVEKSGIGDSEGPPCRSVDFDAELRSYRIALQALFRNPHVDPAHVYIFGHSIGSIEGPLLANELPIKGLIVAEGVGRDWPEYELRNLRRQLELSGDNPADVDKALLEKAQCMVRLLYQREPEATIEQSLPSCAVHNGVYPVDPPYMAQVAGINVMQAWMRIDVPVLTLWGTSDVVAEEADQQRIADVVNHHHPGSATFEPIANMNHLLRVEPTQVYDGALSTAVVRWLQSIQR